jgi:hypothetical protein
MQPPTSDSHVLLRYSDHDAPDCGVIEAHEKILKKRGKVVIGKFGRPLGQLDCAPETGESVGVVL